MGDFIGIAWHGVSEFSHGLDELNARVDRATRAALVANQAAFKRQAKANIRGGPRWSRRGKSSRTGAAVDTGRRPVHVQRGGGPGVLTGALKRGVGSKRPVKTAEGWEGGVGVGGGVRNLYKKRVEADFPYFRPAYEKTVAKARDTHERAWSRAMTR